MGEGLLGAAEIVGLVVLALILPLLLLAARRRWLARQGGTFECSVRLRTTTPGAGWSLGVGRYTEGSLEWFRFFSLSTRPRCAFVRNDVNVVETRDPDPVEAVSLYAGQRIVRIEPVTSGRDTGLADEGPWDLAMSPGSLTGLLSWLEAAPPGLGGY